MDIKLEDSTFNLSLFCILQTTGRKLKLPDRQSTRLVGITQRANWVLELKTLLIERFEGQDEFCARFFWKIFGWGLAIKQEPAILDSPLAHLFEVEGFQGD